jgi:hypothetical protein
LLTNRIYIGEITHKGKSYPAEHQNIIDRATWEAVQAQLAYNAVTRRSGTNAKSPSLLAGLLRDENGRRLKPSHATKGGRRYRYYISHGVDDASASEHASWRLPALTLERLVLRSLCDFLGDRARMTRTLGRHDLAADGLKIALEHASRMRGQIENAAFPERRALLLEIIDRVEIRQDLVRIVLRVNALRTDLAAHDRRGSSADELACIDIPVQLRRRGVELRFVLEGEISKSCKPDAALAGAVVQAHRWFNAIRSGIGTSVSDLASRDGVHQADVSRILPLAFLAPDIVEAILDGRQPVELTAARLKRLRLPLSWADQRRILGFMA